MEFPNKNTQRNVMSSGALPKKSRGWCYTINNYVDKDVDMLRRACTEAVYGVFGREIGAQGTPHLQGYIYWKNARNMQGTKSTLGCDSAHLEIAKGRADQNRIYCTKDGNYEEFGEMPKMGSRTDLRGACELLQAGGIKRIIEESPDIYAKYSTGLHRLQSALFKPRSTAPMVIWLWGDTGCGKSKAAFEFGGDTAYWKSPGKWWDGYEQQKCIIWDDYREHDVPDFNYLLRLTDRYPFQVEYKGGSIHINSETIIITSAKDPEATHHSAGACESILQLLRRIKHTFKITQGENFVLNEKINETVI